MHESVGSLRNTVQVHSCILLQWDSNGSGLVVRASTASEIDFSKIELVSLSPGKVKDMLRRVQRVALVQIREVAAGFLYYLHFGDRVESDSWLLLDTADHPSSLKAFSG